MGRKKIHVYIAAAVLLAVAVLCCLFSAQLEEPYLTAEISVGGKTEQVKLWQRQEGDYVFFLPGYARMEQTRLRTNRGGQFLLGGEPVTDGLLCAGFPADSPCALTDREGNCHGYVHFVFCGGMDTMFLETRSGSMDHIHQVRGNEEAGFCRVYTAGGEQIHSVSVESLKGRGNATWWGSEKKPYSLELAGSADLLGMGAAKKWILLANGTEPSQLRNRVVLDFAAEAGLAYTPESRYVDLYLNGEYVGLYLLTERNEIHAQRVNIGTDGTFLVSMELESRLVEQGYSHVVTEAKQAMRIHECYVEPARVASVLQSAENAILADDGVDPVTGKHWRELIDLDSWAEKYLLEELFANGDACSISQYFYYNGEKLFAGPAWDYDATMLKLTPQTMYGNRFQACEGKPTPWFHSLYQQEEFLERVKQLYAQRFRPLLEELLETGFDEYAARTEQAVRTNALRWPGTDPAASREQAVRYMKERMAFLDSLWLEEEKYCMVFVEFGPWINGAYYAVRPGESLPQLPVYEDTAQINYLGWYDMVSGEVFDVTQPIYEDRIIHLKQETLTREAAVIPEEAGEEDSLSLLRLAPAIAFAAVFAGVILLDIRQNGSGRKKRRP